MKIVSTSKVIADLIIGQAALSLKNYDRTVKKVMKLSRKQQMKLARQQAFPKTWKELFEDDKTIWYEASLPHKSEFVNRIFDSGKGFMTHIGLKHSTLLDMYKMNKLDSEHIKTIDSIRKNLRSRPRIITLTTDFKRYSIFDGARRALAFKLEKKKIPVYIGYKTKFKSLRYMK